MKRKVTTVNALFAQKVAGYGLCECFLPYLTDMAFVLLIQHLEHEKDRIAGLKKTIDMLSCTNK